MNKLDILFGTNSVYSASEFSELGARASGCALIETKHF